MQCKLLRGEPGLRAQGVPLWAPWRQSGKGYLASSREMYESLVNLLRENMLHSPSTIVVAPANGVTTIFLRRDGILACKSPIYCRDYLRA